jgi:hypothetical protein
MPPLSGCQVTRRGDIGKDAIVDLGSYVWRMSSSGRCSRICGNRPDGAFILLRQTIAKRMRAKLLEIEEALYRMCHLPVPEQGRWLGQVLRGYFAYHAVPTTWRRTTAFAFHVLRHWRRALMRRSQKAYIPLRLMKPIAARGIPSARIRHPWPQQCFLVQHPRWEPSTLAAHARICPGARGNPRPYRDGLAQLRRGLAGAVMSSGHKVSKGRSFRATE